jgi:diacylglycerol kinase (ATP)
VSSRVFVVVNPQAGRGRGARLLEPVLSALAAGGAPPPHALSVAPGDETRLAERAAGEGFEAVVAVGGDGTWSNVAAGLLRAGRGTRLGLVPGGTGSDLAKSLGIPGRDIPACARIVREGRVRRIDVGRVEDRYFLNVLGFGYDTAVIEDSWRVRYLRGDLLYLYCALRQVFSFTGFTVEQAMDGAAPVRQDLLMLIVANARHFGGAFRIAPAARLDDGRLDVVAFSNASPLRRLGLIGRLLAGSHAGARGVSFSSAASLRLRFGAPPAYETDGEWNRARSAELTVETLPGALEVLAPAEG